MRLMVFCLAGLAVLACRASENAASDNTAPQKQGETLRIVPDIEKRLAQFAAVPLSPDLSALSPEDRQVLDQAGRGRPADGRDLPAPGLDRQSRDARSGSRAGHRASTRRRRASTSRSTSAPGTGWTERKPFIGDKPHPAGRGLLPGGHDQGGIRGAGSPSIRATRRRFTSDVTVIRRGTDRRPARPCPTRRSTAEWLKPAAKLLREAAALTDNASLKKFLELRAAAFESDDYYASDLAWMDLDAPVEVTIGPYETYEDELFGYKAAFEAFVTVNLPKESAALARYKERLPVAGAQPADPGRAQEPEPRHREPDPGGRHGLHRGRHPGRRADDRLQPAQRRAGARGQGIEEGPAAQHHARQVRQDPDAHRRARARPGAGEGRLLRRLLQRGAAPRAVARPRPGHDHEGRPEDRGAAGAQGALLARSRRPRPT